MRCPTPFIDNPNRHVPLAALLASQVRLKSNSVALTAFKAFSPEFGANTELASSVLWTDSVAGSAQGCDRWNVWLGNGALHSCHITIKKYPLKNVFFNGIMNNPPYPLLLF
jgi:hypothetical protein